jgi:hypothetical protein
MLLLFEKLVLLHRDWITTFHTFACVVQVKAPVRHDRDCGLAEEQGCLTLKVWGRLAAFGFVQSGNSKRLMPTAGHAAPAAFGS